ncbi:MAG: hypothetical protein ACRCST_03530 [Turicibacter sp.]
MAKPQFKKAVDTNIKTDLPTLRQPERFMERTEQISWSKLEKQIEAETETFEREVFSVNIEPTVKKLFKKREIKLDVIRVVHEKSLRKQ